jgi:hypothetical protein
MLFAPVVYVNFPILKEQTHAGRIYHNISFFIISVILKLMFFLLIF